MKSFGRPKDRWKDVKRILDSRINCLTLEDGVDRLSRNVGKNQPLYAAQYPKRAQMSGWKSVNFSGMIWFRIGTSGALF